jgi:ketosteroid isomerase-like protein
LLINLGVVQVGCVNYPPLLSKRNSEEQKQMKLTTLAAMFFVSATTILAQTTGANTKPPKNPAVETLLMKTEREWDDAAVTRDVTVLQRILADEWTYWDTTSRFRTKSQFLDEVKTGTAVCDPIALDDLAVRVYGNTAVVTGREAGSCRGKGGEPLRFRQRFTDVFVQRSGRWQCVATHESPISDEKNPS